jgi:hypothetical protein
MAINISSMVKKVILIIAIASFFLILFLWIFQRPNVEIPDNLPLHLKVEKDYYIYDQVAGHLHKPNASRVFPWKEHQKKTIIMKTNNLGFREDFETSKTKAEGIKRILITGDSHIDGVVCNVESFPNQLEVLLNNGRKNHRYECINAGVGHYGPQNYSGVLKRFLYLKPDVFIVVIYSGNDFMDALYIEELNGRLKFPPRSGDYIEKLQTANKMLADSVAQALNQIYFFKTFPNLMNIAVDITANHLESIKRICEDNHIELLVVFLPTKLDAEMERDKERLMPVIDLLQLSKDQLEINHQIVETLISWLSKENIKHIDLLSPMKKCIRKLFWARDYHLNSRGHLKMARIIYNSPYRSLLE